MVLVAFLWSRILRGCRCCLGGFLVASGGGFLVRLGGVV